MRKWISLVVGLAVGYVGGSGAALAQVVQRERDVTVTGPRGRSIERQFRTERGPGFIDRQMTIQRPGATLRRDVQVVRPPGFVAGGGGGGFVGGGFGGAPGGFVERDVIIDRRPVWGGTSFGFGLPALGFFFGAPAPPPVVLAPAPLYVAPPPAVVAAPPPGAVAAPPTVVADPGADAIHRLGSLHSHSRRDGALTLGRLRDARAVPILTDRLKNDTDREVRVAAAWALGEIGDPRGAVPLQRAALFDHRREVRDAAAEAYRRMPHEEPTSVKTAPVVAGGASDAQPGPAPAARALEDVPPPPPRPEPQPLTPEPRSSSAGFADPN